MSFVVDSLSLNYGLFVLNVAMVVLTYTSFSVWVVALKS